MTRRHRTGTVIVGGGQAGIALSFRLTAAGSPHVVLERGRVGERWHSERWESLSLLTPNWLNRLPGQLPLPDPDGFLSARSFADELAGHARSFRSPVRHGVTVTAVERAGEGFVVTTDGGTWQADNVVVATGDCDRPHLPPVAAAVPRRVVSIHASAYRSPSALPAGGVLVVGAGPSGQQIALELARAGRSVVIAVGRHGRAPRVYRGTDLFRWLARLGDLAQTVEEVADLEQALRSPSLPLLGSTTGEQLDLAVLRDAGVAVTGRLLEVSGSTAVFADDLGDSVADAERRLTRLLGRIDDHVAASRLEVPAGEPLPVIETGGAPTTLDLHAARISSVVWATGYRRAYPWLHVPDAVERGELVHRRGVTPVPGLFALGLRFQWRRDSHFIGGVGRDAAHLTELITQPVVTPARRPARVDWRRIRIASYAA